jgi:hypothetical protein
MYSNTHIAEVEQEIVLGASRPSSLVLALASLSAAATEDWLPPPWSWMSCWMSYWMSSLTRR